jgi:hypothetical protein
MAAVGERIPVGMTLELPEVTRKILVSPIRIERTTLGLVITLSTTSDNLTPQETTTQELGTVDADGAGLSCPGSREVAESEDIEG